MKTLQLLGIALAGVALASCSKAIDYTPDESEYPVNTASGVTVAMEEVQMSVTENVGLFNVPVVVKGATNGYVKVTLQCVETGSDPAIPDADYFLTNYEQKGNTTMVRIDSESKTANVEIRTVDRRGEDPTRTFIVKIVKCEGATVAEPSQTLVEIVDKGPSPKYNQLGGNWIMTGIRLNTSGTAIDDEFVQEVVFTANDPDEKVVKVTGITGAAGDSYTMALRWDYDDEEKWGQLVLDNEADAGNYGQYLLKWGTPSSLPLEGRWNSSYSAASFGDSESEIYVDAYNGGALAGTLDIFGGFTFMRLD